MKSRAFVLNDIGKLDFQELELRKLKPGEVLVEVKAAGICGSDIPRVFKTGTYHFPTIPGHEFSGQVAAVSENAGEEEKGWLGKRVGIFPLIPCKDCEPCRKKQYEMCQHYDYLGSRSDGGFSEYVIVPVWNLISLPDEVSFEEAAMLEPAAVALHALRRLDLSQVESVALFGLGTIGSLIAEWLSIYGVKKVYATGHGEENGKLLKQISPEYRYLDTTKTEQSVSEWIGECTEDSGVDAVIDCVNRPESVTDALNLVKAGGQVLLVGNPSEDFTLEKAVYWKLLRKQIRMTGTWNSTFTHEEEDDWHTVLRECGSGRLKLRAFITHRYAFEDLPKGLRLMRDKEEYHNKVMITRG